jgi:hypothetical protein
MMSHPHAELHDQPTLRSGDGEVSIAFKRAEIERKVAQAGATTLHDRLEAELSRKQAELRNPLLRVPPPQPRYRDYVTGELLDWPRRADGLLLSGAQVAAKLRRNRSYIWGALPPVSSVAAVTRIRRCSQFPHNPMHSSSSSI